MRMKTLSKALLVALGSSHLLSVPTLMAADDPRPNILLFLADDMGYSDISGYGGEIETPNLDELSKNGLNFTNYYSSASCTPSRSIIMSGVDNHRNGVGSMASNVRAVPIQQGQPGYEGVLNDRVVSTATRLRDAGYHTYMVGKWHLGGDTFDETTGKFTDIEKRPFYRGFEQTFTMLEGAASHYADLMGFVPAQPTVRYSKNGRDIPVENFTANFYSTRFYTDRMIGYIDGNIDDGKPFFAYMAFTAPHAPLHAPAENIAKYKDVYTKGWDAIRQERFTRMKNMGLIPSHITLPSRIVDANTNEEMVVPWDSLSAAEQEFNARLMAVYAGMIDYLDFSIGRVITHLKEIGEYENSIMIFQSDNGPHEKDRVNVAPTDVSYAKWFADAADPTIDKHPNFAIDNSTENMGLPRSFLMPGFGWAQVSATPLYGTKSTMAEGGVRVPFIVSYPNHIKPGRTKEFASIIDLLPTFLDYAEAPEPSTVYKDKCVFSLDGRSMRAMWEGRNDKLYTDNDNVAFELFGSMNKSLYSGDWKILRLGDDVWGDGENQPWKLFNLAIDPRELFDLSGFYPEIMAEMIVAYDQYEKDVGFISTSDTSIVNKLMLKDMPSRFAVSVSEMRNIVSNHTANINYNNISMSPHNYLAKSDIPAVQYATWGANGLSVFDSGAAMRIALANTGPRNINNVNVQMLQGLSVVYNGVSISSISYLPIFEANPEQVVPLVMVLGTRFGETVLYATPNSTKTVAMVNNKPAQCSDITGQPEGLNLSAEAVTN